MQQIISLNNKNAFLFFMLALQLCQIHDDSIYNENSRGLRLVRDNILNIIMRESLLLLY